MRSSPQHPGPVSHRPRRAGARDSSSAWVATFNRPIGRLPARPTQGCIPPQLSPGPFGPLLLTARRCIGAFRFTHAGKRRVARRTTRPSASVSPQLHHGLIKTTRQAASKRPCRHPSTWRHSIAPFAAGSPLRERRCGRS
ncbi:hypothetical protein K505DRAFT_3191 [Melanomma pulvis-pyrius CBS 109.77]|uniref:Uncharacterized protein n=1 Tax=Melanomma pulvis-pyrius CBS 109.77 TaxID=1314802 RepID=A0A6A6WP46_9PLEO|nr:hypothetical protein K505DRAFT_3191 [Melanomma pulvis-pyrius CBS 109.77]